jgi:E3 ubiquitin-protein ligase BRE1
MNCNKQLEEEVWTLKKKVEQSGSNHLLKEKNSILKGKLCCSVCNEHEKDVVITWCFHCFCWWCIQKNLEVWSRKCLACQQQFGENDVHAIYLS